MTSCVTLKERLTASDNHVKRIADEKATLTARMGAFEIRMASWLVDRTAAETADHYRAKFDAVAKDYADAMDRLRAVFITAERAAGKRKAVAEGVRLVRSIFEGRP
jgi:hypothetical protein